MPVYTTFQKSGRKYRTYHTLGGDDTYELSDCIFCNGTGRYWGTTIDPSDRGEWCECPKCDGRGEIETLVDAEEDAA